MSGWKVVVAVVAIAGFAAATAYYASPWTRAAGVAVDVACAAIIAATNGYLRGLREGQKDGRALGFIDGYMERNGRNVRVATGEVHDEQQ